MRPIADVSELMGDNRADPYWNEIGDLQNATRGNTQITCKTIKKQLLDQGHRIFSII